MELKHLTPEMIENGPIPMDDLLKDSVYYPASRLDGRVIQFCNTLPSWRMLGVNSFVYADFDVSETELLRDVLGTRSLCGYRVLGHRRLRPEEYIPEGWKLEMVDGHYWDTFLGRKDGPGHYAHWVVFERKETKTILHGPDRISLLFVCGEGLATFQQLYCSRGIAPKMACAIQCWGFAGNWTDFTAPGAPVHNTLLKYRHCIPEWICIGDHWEIHGVLRLRGLDYAGVRLVGYWSGKALTKRFGEENLIRVSTGKHEKVYVAAHEGRRYAAVCISGDAAFVVYDITMCRFSVDTLVDWLTMTEKDRFANPMVQLNHWAGLLGEVSAPRELTTPVFVARMGEPILDEKLNWRGRYPIESKAKALAVVHSISHLFREEGVTMCTLAMQRAIFWAEYTLMSHEDPDLAADLQECRWCIARLQKSKQVCGIYPFF